MEPQKEIRKSQQYIELLDERFMNELKKANVMTKDQFSSLVERSRGDQDKIERLLVSEGFVSDKEKGRMKAQAHGWKYVDLYTQLGHIETLKLIPYSVAREQKAVPFRKMGNVVSVAMKNPDDKLFVSMLQKKFQGNVKIYHATETAIVDALSHYEKGFERLFERILATDEGESRVQDVTDDFVIDLVDSLLLHGTHRHASDIHIEPQASETIVRERIDGILQSTVHFSQDVHKLVVLRIKILANLATDEHAAPQDAKIQYVTPGGKKIDVRVSILATTHGEKIVLRLLSGQDKPLTLNTLGFSEHERKIVEDESKSSWGMILATGPTGSGKSTTLYSIMRELNSDEVNVSTIEDPVEYDLPGANQIQVNPKVDLTFASGLRSIVRQDPDIILVGEIRDQETAGIAINSAMTGHLVLSTLHTNDAATAIPRLIDMGVEPFLIASTVNLIVAQRLVRKVCNGCKESYEMTASELKGSIHEDIYNKLVKGRDTLTLYRGKGCTLCGGDGYLGRTVIAEALQVTGEIQALIMSNAHADRINETAIRSGMETMLDGGVSKVLSGITTLEEVLRVIRA